MASSSRPRRGRKLSDRTRRSPHRERSTRSPSDETPTQRTIRPPVSGGAVGGGADPPQGSGGPLQPASGRIEEVSRRGDEAPSKGARFWRYAVAALILGALGAIFVCQPDPKRVPVPGPTTTTTMTQTIATPVPGPTVYRTVPAGTSTIIVRERGTNRVVIVKVQPSPYPSPYASPSPCKRGPKILGGTC